VAISHSLTLESELPEASSPPWGAKATHRTASACPVSVYRAASLTLRPAGRTLLAEVHFASSFLISGKFAPDRCFAWLGAKRAM
jgi:hypothetical protein